MATEPYGIATRGNCNNIAGSTVISGDITKCPTKAEILATGKLKLTGGSYADNQCVQYAHLAAANTLTISPGSQSVVAGGSSFTLTITCNTSWTISANVSWMNFNKTSGTGNGSVTVTVPANTSTAVRNGVITVTVSGVPPKTCSVSQAGKAFTTVNVQLYIAGGDPMSIQGINVYTVDGVFVSYKALGGGLGGGLLDDLAGQAIPNPGPMLIQFSGDQPRDVRYYDSSGGGGVTVTKEDSYRWRVSGYSFGSNEWRNQLGFGVFR